MTKKMVDVTLGERVILRDFINLYGCVIGDDTRIGTFVEIQRNVSVGARCKISSHTFICEGVELEDEVFVGHNVSFINDHFPRSQTDGSLDFPMERLKKILVKKGASIGSGATILDGVVIGERSIVGAGSVVTKDVPPGVVVVGVPAVFLRSVGED